MQLRWNRQQK